MRTMNTDVARKRVRGRWSKHITDSVPSATTTMRDVSTRERTLTVKPTITVADGALLDTGKQITRCEKANGESKPCDVADQQPVSPHASDAKLVDDADRVQRLVFTTRIEDMREVLGWEKRTTQAHRLTTPIQHPPLEVTVSQRTPRESTGQRTELTRKHEAQPAHDASHIAYQPASNLAVLHGSKAQQNDHPPLPKDESNDVDHHPQKLAACVAPMHARIRFAQQPNEDDVNSKQVSIQQPPSSLVGTRYLHRASTRPFTNLEGLDNVTCRLTGTRKVVSILSTPTYDQQEEQTVRALTELDANTGNDTLLSRSEATRLKIANQHHCNGSLTCSTDVSNATAQLASQEPVVKSS